MSHSTPASDALGRFRLNAPAFVPGGRPEPSPLVSSDAATPILSASVPAFTPRLPPPPATSATEAPSLSATAAAFVPTVPQGPIAASTAQDAAPEADDQFAQGEESFHARVLSYDGSYSVVDPDSRRRTWQSRFMAPSLYRYFQAQTAAMVAHLDGSDDRYKEVPPKFTCVLPLDSEQSRRGTSGSMGYVSTMFKVTSNQDSIIYALRRVDKARLTPALMGEAQCTLERWSKFAHPSIIALRDVFAFQRALFFLHDYFPTARTVKEAYMASSEQFLPEPLLWSIICQLASALRAVHHAGLSTYGLSLNRVLVTGPNRVRISNCGVLEVLEHESHKHMQELHKVDVKSFASVVLQLATQRTLSGASTVTSLSGGSGGGGLGSRRPTIDAHRYSDSLRDFVDWLFNQLPTMEQVCNVIAPRMTETLDAFLDHADAMESVMMREAENGRLFRLMVKLGYVNERPEYSAMPGQTEAGDEYVLKLFRDFVFHQIDDRGQPVLNVGHAVDALMKLDVGDEEKMVLCSRDGESMLITSYADVRRCLNKCYEGLRMRRADHPMSAALAAKATTAKAGRGGRGGGGHLGPARSGRGGGPRGRRPRGGDIIPAAMMGTAGPRGGGGMRGPRPMGGPGGFMMPMGGGPRMLFRGPQNAMMGGPLSKGYPGPGGYVPRAPPSS